MKVATILCGRRRIAIVFAALTVAALSAGPGEARHYVRHAINEGGGPSPPYAAIVVDGNTSAVLHASNPDELRHPASLTKIMTLYLLFERLESGKLKLDSPLEVSVHAAEQSPTKLGLKPGDTIDVDSAIRGLVTRSANDAAVVIAEAIGGSERDFAEMMTRKAHAIGMSRTVYRNASGLPDDDQVTTARDQALLGRAIQERFPKYYRYFSTTSFTYHGVAIRNHNNLLGRVEGVDGIKTGYTQASGFNLVTSVHRDSRFIVAVVLGGASAGARDARMRSLIEEYVHVASTQKSAPSIFDTDTRIADAKPAEAKAAEPRAPDAKAPDAKTARAPVHPNPATVYAVASYSRPIPWPTPQTSAAAPTTVTAPQPAPGTAEAVAAEPAPALAPPAPTPAAHRDVPQATPATIHREAATATVPNPDEPVRPIAVRTLKVKLPPSQVAELAPPINTPGETASSRPEPLQDRIAAALATRSTPPLADPAPVREAIAAVQAPPPAAPAAPAPSAPTTVHTGWMVQIGAYDDERSARDKLSAAQAKASLLARADAFTEPVVKGEKTLYRARFAGLHREEAESVCKQLRRNDIECMTVRN